MSSTTWTIAVTAQQIEVKISTYHEPILCDGAYRGQEEQGMLQLFYNGEDTSCRHEKPNFTIKKEQGRYFIQGPFGEANYNTWLELDKIDSTNSTADTITCTDFEVEMGKGTRCFYPGRKQESTYELILKEYKEESKHLLSSIPATDTSYESNRDDEQVQVTYTVSKNKTDIALAYPGGVTEIDMTEANNGTTTRIIYNAD